MEIPITSSTIITMVKTSTSPIALTVSTDMVTTLPIVGITILTIMTRSTGITGIHQAGALALAGDGVPLATATGEVPGTGAEAIGVVVTGVVVTGVRHTTRTGQRIHTITIATTSAMGTGAPITELLVAADIAAAIR